MRLARVVLFVAACCASPALARAQTGSPGLTGESSEARWIVDPRERAVGELVEVALLVPLASGERLELDSSALEADLSWVVEGAPRRGSVPAAGGAPAGVLLSWSFASFEAGERDVPAPLLVRVDAAGKRAPLAVAPTKLRFTSVLVQGEDEARPALGFRPLEDEAAASSTPAWLAGCAALAVALAAWLVSRRRARSTNATPPTALERLAALESKSVETREGAREVIYELVELVRSHFDARSGVARAALTDREWLAAAAAGLEADVAAELDALLRDAEPVKYALHHPTHWAVREALQRARKVLSSHESAQGRAA